MRIVNAAVVSDVLVQLGQDHFEEANQMCNDPFSLLLSAQERATE